MTKGSVVWGENIPISNEGVQNFQTGIYNYKIWTHDVSSASVAKMAFTPWFKCQYGSLAVPTIIKGKTLYVTSTSDQ